MNKTLLSAFILVLGFVIAAPAFACKGAGENAHMGVITAINQADKTVTLKDAETGQPIVFKASEDVLKTAIANSKVTIHYKKEGKDLIAEMIMA